MRFAQGFLLLLLLVISLFLVHEEICKVKCPSVLETYNTNLKCRCRETSNHVPIAAIERIQIIRAGNGCPKVEIIVWMKTKKPICLNPQSKWTRALLRALQKKGNYLTTQVTMLKKKTT